MTNESRLARWAGLVYLIVVVAGFFSQGYVPGKIAAPGNPEALLGNIVAHQTLFRAGIAAFLVEQVAFLAVPLLLFRLLGSVHRAAAVAMVAFAFAGVPMALVAVTHRLDALLLLTDAGGLPVDLAHAMARISMKSYANGILLASVFWGLWLLPFGYLVIRCGRLPRILGVLLMLGGAGYMVDIFGQLLVPGYAEMAFSNYVNLPAALGEVGIMLWLLVMGIGAGNAHRQSGNTL
ncbi:DUF4386 domain-containing protein [Rhodanobacter sp. AS-Z3]|uniref:DUF4386 domain-containing protein n=1 Tax=Rhodanobacter sp. AS-Z3 TaxID=3031330 RepID=UPI002479DF81|nr:DUF4386 domain-containing protein [Rhodanobacter sp. AS-Z3]WEN13433.1 DUF4386 domain-containing protein [Rhodanobacter sp. AS-Z3]